MQKSIFKIMLSVCAVALIMFVSAPASAGPVGELPKLNDHTVQILAFQGKSVSDMKSEIPSKETVGLPIYPGSVYTTEFLMEGMPNTVVMASQDPMEEIKEWYSKQEELTWSDMMQMFYVGDEYVMMQSEAVMLMDISEDPQVSAGGLAFDMTGMKTQISISYNPKSGE